MCTKTMQILHSVCNSTVVMLPTLCADVWCFGSVGVVFTSVNKHKSSSDENLNHLPLFFNIFNSIDN